MRAIFFCDQPYIYLVNFQLLHTMLTVMWAQAILVGRRQFLFSNVISALFTVTYTKSMKMSYGMQFWGRKWFCHFRRQKWLIHFPALKCMAYDILSMSFILSILSCSLFEIVFFRLCRLLCIYAIYLCVSPTQWIFGGKAWIRMVSPVALFTKTALLFNLDIGLQSK